jgi:hypothetical protein
MARNFGGIFEFSMFKISPEGVRTELDADDEEDDYYEVELGDAIHAHVTAFLEECVGVKDFRFQVETYANNGGPLIDYFLTAETEDDRSPMWELSLESISVPWPDRGDGWRIGVSAGGVRLEKEQDEDGNTIVSEEEDEEEEEEVADADPAIVATSGFSHDACIAAAEKSELYPPLVAYLESLPGMTVHVSPKNGDTLGVNTAGEVFKIGIDDRKVGRERFELWRIGKSWNADKKTYRLVF